MWFKKKQKELPVKTEPIKPLKVEPTGTPIKKLGMQQGITRQERRRRWRDSWDKYKL